MTQQIKVGEVGEVVVQYNNELIVLSKNIDAIQTALDEDNQRLVYTLPYHTFPLIVREEILSRTKRFHQKFRHGVLISGDEDYFREINRYIELLIFRYQPRLDYLYLKSVKQSIDITLHRIYGHKDSRLTRINLETIKDKIIALFDSLYFDEAPLEDQINTGVIKVDLRVQLAKLLALDESSGYRDIKSVVYAIFAEGSLLNQFTFGRSLKDYRDESVRLVINAQYPYEEILYDILKDAAVTKLDSNNFYPKYASTSGLIVFELSYTTDAKASGVPERFVQYLENYLLAKDKPFRISLAADFGGIWSVEFANCKKEKFAFGHYLVNLMQIYEEVWTQDYAVSTALVIIVHSLKSLVSGGDSDIILNQLYKEWMVQLFTETQLKSLQATIREGGAGLKRLKRQVASVEADIPLLAEFQNHTDSLVQLTSIREIITMLCAPYKAHPNPLIYTRIVIDIFKEVCDVLGVYSKNLPYIAMILSQHQSLLWRTI